MRRRTAGWILCLLAELVCFPCILSAQRQAPSEYQIKAIYLYNFTRFVEWPQEAAQKNEPFAICVIGKDPFGAILDNTVAEDVHTGRNLVARRISKPQEGLGCRILFVSASEEARLKEILAALEKSSVLTVSDISRFSQRGGMIQFVLEEGKVRFEVNLKTTSDAGLTLSSELLKVAVAIRRNPQPGD